jgi:hypothetical protein
MKRFLTGAAVGIGLFSLGIVFTIVVGVYLSGDSSQAPAVLQPSNYGYSI